MNITSIDIKNLDRFKDIENLEKLKIINNGKYDMINISALESKEISNKAIKKLFCGNKYVVNKAIFIGSLLDDKINYKENIDKYVNSGIGFLMKNSLYMNIESKNHFEYEGYIEKHLFLFLAFEFNTSIYEKVINGFEYFNERIYDYIIKGRLYEYDILNGALIYDYVRKKYPKLFQYKINTINMLRKHFFENIGNSEYKQIGKDECLAEYISNLEKQIDSTLENLLQTKFIKASIYL